MGSLKILTPDGVLSTVFFYSDLRWKAGEITHGENTYKFESTELGFAWISEAFCKGKPKKYWQIDSLKWWRVQNGDECRGRSRKKTPTRTHPRQGLGGKVSSCCFGFTDAWILKEWIYPAGNQKTKTFGLLLDQNQNLYRFPCDHLQEHASTTSPTITT